MGNSCWSKESQDITHDVRKQGDHSSNSVYKLVDLNDGGELVELCRLAKLTGNFSKLDAKIQDITSMMYHRGKGYDLPLIEILNYRDMVDYRSIPANKSAHRKRYRGRKYSLKESNSTMAGKSKL